MDLLAQADAEVQLTPLQRIINSPFLLMGGLLALFYMMVLAPERRRKAAEIDKMSSLKKNDRIVTIGGIHGVVSALNDADTITIRVDENGSCKMKLDRRAVARVLTEKAESPPS